MSNAGNRILQALISRNHQIAAVARDDSKVPATVTDTTCPKISLYPSEVLLRIDPGSRLADTVTPTFTFKKAMAFFSGLFPQQSGYPYRLNYTSMWTGFKF